MPSKKWKRIPITILLLFAVIGCNQRHSDSGMTEGNENSSSRLPVTEKREDNPKDIALCNRLETTDFTAHLMVYYSQDGTYHPEYIRLWLPIYKEAWTDKSYQMVVRKWAATKQGETTQDPIPLKWRIEPMGGLNPDGVLLTGFDMNSLHWPTLASKLQKLSGYSYTLSEALTNFSFVIDLKDPYGTFDVLKFSLYKEGKLQMDWNMLLPAFYAHPQTYAAEQNSVLTQLHPFSASYTSGTNGDFYAGVLNSYCF